MANTDIINAAKQLAAVCDELPFCECGCGERVKTKGKRFIHGHNRRGVSLPLRTPEHCANLSASLTGRTLSTEHCVAITKGLKESDAAKTHNESMRGVPRPPEVCDAIKKTHTGIPLSPEHIASLENHWENMRGGNDLVTHHYIYDESDLSLNTVKITRKDHMRLHMLLKKLGYIVPHINVKEDEGDEQ